MRLGRERAVAVTRQIFMCGVELFRRDAGSFPKLSTALASRTESATALQAPSVLRIRSAGHQEHRPHAADGR